MKRKDFSKSDNELIKEVVTVKIDVEIEWDPKRPGARKHALSMIAPWQHQAGAHIDFGCYGVKVLGLTKLRRK